MDLVKRRWNDFKLITDLKRGPFTAKELKKVRDLLCQWAKKHSLSPEELGELCSDTRERTSSKVWLKIAQYFPRRSVQSIHNVCKRVFNPNNYKGSWELWEEQELIDYVRTNGHKWKEIGEMLGRTALNVKDKWKQMGGSALQSRKKGPWSASEISSLVRLVQKNTGFTPVSAAVFAQCDGLPGEEEAIGLLCPLIQGDDGLRTVKDLNWNAISQLIVTRSEVDCRLKWGRCLQGRAATTDSFTYEEDLKLITSIEEQGADDLFEVKWDHIQTGRTANENKARFKTLFNVTCGRLKLTLEEVLKQLKHAYTVYQEDEGSIVDFYKKHYLMHK